MIDNLPQELFDLVHITLEDMEEKLAYMEYTSLIEIYETSFKMGQQLKKLN